ncbi:MAG: NDP-sugar synthase [Deltaproteobacteria bacterium]|nr:NDP-sugar synthase [Deltaproteobacteria bacterium]MBW2417703.1 NDP-sugar synthase [Deltaproteobacteria bacterium]
MRAMILAAGLGTRLRPLSQLCAKPAMPVRGIPVIAYLLALLRAHGVDEVMVNLHHRPDTIRNAVERFGPSGITVRYSAEEAPLGTGGGIRRAAAFLRESDPCIVLAGDMLLDADLGALVERHRSRGDAATLLLREDSRSEAFGTLGMDDQNCVRRIGQTHDFGGESASGVFLGVRVLAARLFDSIPAGDDFEDLRDWLAPALEAGAQDIRGELVSERNCLWEPVGTPPEYLRVNLEPRPLTFMNAETLACADGTHFEKSLSLVVGRGARIEPGARLRRVVVWEDEVVPADFRGSDGVYAGGVFHNCLPE